ncbi:hypothetical protein RYA71_28770, partial [Pseudomonas syringae pv. actinidiae]|uniref:hypothetical protein n=1 Tax=Pseudomonas syringae TaxID=317 RepID=UPI0012AE7C5F
MIAFFGEMGDSGSGRPLLVGSSLRDYDHETGCIEKHRERRMKLAMAQLIVILASIGLGEAGQRTADLAYTEAGIFALLLGCVLMMAGFGLELFELLREK